MSKQNGDLQGGSWQGHGGVDELGTTIKTLLFMAIIDVYQVDLDKSKHLLLFLSVSLFAFTIITYYKYGKGNGTGFRPSTGLKYWHVLALYRDLFKLNYLQRLFLLPC